jgi:hypothetical protein
MADPVEFGTFADVMESAVVVFGFRFVVGVMLFVRILPGRHEAFPNLNVNTFRLFH